jgi:putative spermidine/putrescine transport system permease protein
VVDEVRRSRRPAKTWQQDLGRPTALALLTPASALLALAFLVPLGWLVWISLTDPSAGPHGYAELAGRGAARRSFQNTAVTSAIVTVVSVAIGAFLAWELRNARSVLYRGLLWGTLLFPLWTSVIVRNYALTLILQRNGPVNDAVTGVGLTSQPVDLLYTTAAVVIGMVHSMVPYAALPLYAAFVLVDDDLLWAARSLGASRRRALVSIVLPLVLPSVIVAATLVFVVSVGFYVTPTVLGGPRNLFVATFIDQEVNQLFDVPGAAVASVVLVAGGLGVVLLVSALVGWRRIERSLS